MLRLTLFSRDNQVMASGIRYNDLSSQQHRWAMAVDAESCICHTGASVNAFQLIPAGVPLLGAWKGKTLSECGRLWLRHLEQDSNLLPFHQALSQCLPPLSACVCLPAGNSDDSSDGTSSDDEMDVAEEPCVCSPALCVQVASSTRQGLEPAAGSLELAAQEAQDPQLCQSVDCLLCDSLEALLF